MAKRSPRAVVYRQAGGSDSPAYIQADTLGPSCHQSPGRMPAEWPLAYHRLSWVCWDIEGLAEPRFKDTQLVARTFI